MLRELEVEKEKGYVSDHSSGLSHSIANTLNVPNAAGSFMG